MEIKFNVALQKAVSSFPQLFRLFSLNASDKPQVILTTENPRVILRTITCNVQNFYILLEHTVRLCAALKGPQNKEQLGLFPCSTSTD